MTQPRKNFTRIAKRVRIAKKQAPANSTRLLGKSYDVSHESARRYANGATNERLNTSRRRKIERGVREAVRKLKLLKKSYKFALLGLPKLRKIIGWKEAHAYLTDKWKTLGFVAKRDIPSRSDYYRIIGASKTLSDKASRTREVERFPNRAATADEIEATNRYVRSKSQ
jgi:hypothetical protein